MPAKIVVSRRVASAKCNLYLCRFMKDAVYNIKDRIIAIIDLFYPPFARLMDRQTFRYAACGGTNTAFDIFLFTFIIHYVLHEQIVHVGPIAISPHIAAFLFSFPVTFVTGFFLMRYVVFPESATTRKRVQMTKYLSVVFVCFLLNYGFLKLFSNNLFEPPYLRSTPRKSIKLRVLITGSFRIGIFPDIEKAIAV